MEEFKLRTIEEFGSDIDIESYLFFYNIIYCKASCLITDLSNEEIFSYKEMSAEDCRSHQQKDLIRIVKWKPNVKSDHGLIQRLAEQKEVDRDELPHYLLLDESSEKSCKDIESTYGIACYSLKRLFVKENFRTVSLTKLKNTKGDLYHKLSHPAVNSIHINDPYFFINAKKEENEETLSLCLNQLLKHCRGYKTTLNIKLSTVLNPSKNEENKDLDFENWVGLFRKKIVTSCNKSSFEAVCLTKKGLMKKIIDPKEDRHDRYIFSNRQIVIIGNSFFTNKRTHFTAYPIGIYGEFLMNDLENS
jgi:hypothetical protein